MTPTDLYFLQRQGRPFGRAERPLADRVSEAVAWGAPDSESTGMSHSELTSLLAEQQRRISELERENRELRKQIHG